MIVYSGRPFCGCPDALFAREETSLPRWPDRRIPWTLEGPWTVADLNRAAIRACFATAWQQWAEVCDIEPVYVENAAEALVRIRQAPIDGPGGVLAWSELPDGTRTPRHQRYDRSEVWTVAVEPRGGAIDLSRVACHEIGHALGIGHLPDGNLMQRAYSVAIRGPQPGDIAEARRRYGMPQQPIPTATVVAVDVELARLLAALHAAGYRVNRLGLTEPDAATETAHQGCD